MWEREWFAQLSVRPAGAGTVGICGTVKKKKTQLILRSKRNSYLKDRHICRIQQSQCMFPGTDRDWNSTHLLQPHSSVLQEDRGVNGVLVKLLRSVSPEDIVFTFDIWDLEANLETSPYGSWFGARHREERPNRLATVQIAIYWATVQTVNADRQYAKWFNIWNFERCQTVYKAWLNIYVENRQWKRSEETQEKDVRQIKTNKKIVHPKKHPHIILNLHEFLGNYW